MSEGEENARRGEHAAAAGVLTACGPDFGSGPGRRLPAVVLQSDPSTIDVGPPEVTLLQFATAILVLLVLLAATLLARRRRQFAGLREVSEASAVAKRKLRLARDVADLRTVRLSRRASPEERRDLIAGHLHALDAARAADAGDGDGEGGPPTAPTPTTVGSVLSALASAGRVAWRHSVGQAVADAPGFALRLGRLAVLLAVFGATAVASDLVAAALRYRPAIGIEAVLAAIATVVAVVADGFAVLAGAVAAIPGAVLVGKLLLLAGILVGRAVYAYGWVLAVVLGVLVVVLWRLDDRVTVRPEDVPSPPVRGGDGRTPRLRRVAATWGRPLAAAGIAAVWLVPTASAVVTLDRVVPSVVRSPTVVGALAAAGAVVGIVGLNVFGALAVRVVEPLRPVRRWLDRVDEVAAGDPEPGLARVYLVLRGVSGPLGGLAGLLVVVYAVGALVSGGLLEVALAAATLIPYVAAALVAGVVAALALYRPARSVARTFLLEAMARQQVRLAATVVGIPTIAVAVVYVFAVGVTGRALPSAATAIVVGLVLYKAASMAARARAAAPGLVPERQPPPHVVAQCAVLRVDLGDVSDPGVDAAAARTARYRGQRGGGGSGPGDGSDAGDAGLPETWYYVRINATHELLHPNRAVVVRDAAYLASALLAGKQVEWEPPRAIHRLGIRGRPTFADRPPSMWVARFGFEYGLVAPADVRVKLREMARRALFHCLRSEGPVVSEETMEPFVGPFPDAVVEALIREHAARGNLRRRDDGLELHHDPATLTAGGGDHGPLALPRQRKARR